MYRSRTRSGRSRIVAVTVSRLISAEKVLALVALASALGVAAWWWTQQVPLRRLRVERVAVELSGAVYVAAALPETPSPAPAWRKPGAQSAGGGWIYELFTPPVIYYHAATRVFTVTPPTYAAEKADLPFGLELLAVKREPFRLQLVGYVGAPGDYLAAFVSEQTPETLLARIGGRFDRLGLALRSFEIRRLNVAPPTQPPVLSVAAVATLRDERTGEEVTLDTLGPRLTDTPLAVLRVRADAKAKPRVLHQGDTFQQDDATFRVEHIQLDPPEVVVAKQTAGLPYPEMRVLKPEATAAKAAAAAAATARRFADATAKPGVARRASRP
ncbi:MAG: hypothetical protein HYV96_21045 [Opitutae bacterium]|nr:hypothetical protein [Opitutae bacterium]